MNGDPSAKKPIPTEAVDEAAAEEAPWGICKEKFEVQRTPHHQDEPPVRELH